MFRNNLNYNATPDASAIVNGNRSHPELYGVVQFYQMPFGVFVIAQFHGLPITSGVNPNPFLGFHIHENDDCSQNVEDDFNMTGSHYNPDNSLHPNHRGDLPPILNCNGYAWQSFLTNSFVVSEIIGRSVVVHNSFDDFVTQPSGNSGAKIGCGVITANK